MDRNVYKFTFEDGSEYLMHYGVKGMKWNQHLKALDPEYLASLGLGGAQNIQAQVAAGAAAAEYAVQDTLANVQKTAEDIAKEAEKKKQWLHTQFLGPKKFDPKTGPVDSEKNIEYAKKHPDIIRIKKEEWTADQDMGAVNQNHRYGMRDYEQGKVTDGSSRFTNSLINCATCSMVYDLRRRGYDVDANMSHNAAYTLSDIPKMYEGAKRTYVPGSNLDTCDRMLNRQPDGARGMLCGATVNGGGHAIAWEKENGKVVYRDCQTNTKYNSANELRELMSESYSRANNQLSYYRLDNCEPKLPTLHQQGLISKTGTEYTYREQRDDMTRNAAGQMLQQYRTQDYQVEQFFKQHPLLRPFAKVQKDSPVQKVAKTVDYAKRTYDAYDEAAKLERTRSRRTSPSFRRTR